MTDKKAVAYAKELKKFCWNKDDCRGCPFCVEVVEDWGVLCRLSGESPGFWRTKEEAENND